MSANVLIGFLFFSVIFYNSEPTFAFNEDIKNLSDVLIALLGHQQWTKITDVEAKHTNLSNQFVSFSGKDLFIYRGLFSRTKNIENSYVSVDNVFRKHYMVFNFLTCVYAYAINLFRTLIIHLLDLRSNEAERLRKKAFYYKCTKNKRKKIDSENKTHKHVFTYNSKLQSLQYIPKAQLTEHDKNDDKENDDAEEKEKQCSWGIFNFTYQKLLDSQPMFAYMYDSLDYLLKLIPPEQYSLYPDITGILKVIKLVVWYKDISVYLNDIRPTFIDGKDVKYKFEIGYFSAQLSKAIKHRNKHYWKPFVDNCCTLPLKDNQDIKNLIKQFKTQHPDKEEMDMMYQFGTQIQELVNIVINNYYLDLGFVNTRE